MKCTVTRKKDVDTSVWSGGTTAQLFIYPPDASYASRNFEIRISSATVEEEISTFTNLPGYHRILMPLNAPLKLVYHDRGEILINRLESTEFEGEWRTTSHGFCTDLGIMLADGWQGKLEAINYGTYSNDSGFIGVYALADHVEVSVKGCGESLQHTLMQGDFLLLESQAELTLKSTNENGAVLIRVFRA